MRAAFRQALALFLILGCVAGCNKTPPVVAQLPSPPVSVATPLARTIVDFDEFEGRIEAIERVDLRARVRGYVTRVDFENGQLVKKGDVLYEIDPRPYEAELAAANAQKAAADAALELANVEFERTRQLVQNNAATESDLDQWTARQGVAQADLLKAEAQIQEAKLNVEFTKITAPIEGRISRNNVTAGNLVSGQGDVVLATVVSTTPIYVRFEVDERRLLSYRRQVREEMGTNRDPNTLREANIPVYVALDGDEGFPHQGVIDSSDNTIRTTTGTISILGVLDNDESIFNDGLRARVRVPVGEPYEAVLVSERAIGSEQGIRFVYVVDEENKVRQRDVKLGRLLGDMQVIRSGLKADERIVVNGIQRVRNGIVVEPEAVEMPGTPPDNVTIELEEAGEGDKPTEEAPAESGAES